jgi:hypothetical protein
MMSLRANTPMKKVDTKSADAVLDLKACDAWLAHAPLAESRAACRALAALLETLEVKTPGDAVYLDILERLRAPIAVATAEHAKKYSVRPLPLREHEGEAVDQVLDLFDALQRAYSALLEGIANDPLMHPELAGKQALIAQRALDTTVDLMLTHYRSRREIDGALWQRLHGDYRLAEQIGVTRSMVPVGRKTKSVSSAGEVYARALLLALGNPYALSARELNWMRRWSAKWGYKVALNAGMSGEQAYAIDSTGSAGPSWISAEAMRPGMLFIDTADIKRSIRSRLKKLEEGEDPETLGLGKDCVQPECGRLLINLLRAWTEAPLVRQFSRHAKSGYVELIVGFEAIHTAISGRAFKNETRHWDYTRKETENLYTYHLRDKRENDANAVRAAEQWETLDESPTGFRLRRNDTEERLYQQQLIALKLGGAQHFMLCNIRWLMSGIDRSIALGAASLPGIASGIAVRPAVPPTQAAESFLQGFLLPAMGRIPASLILPVGWYQAGHELEVRIEENVKHFRLLTHLQRGYDYDRASFEEA